MGNLLIYIVGVIIFCILCLLSVYKDVCEISLRKKVDKVHKKNEKYWRR